MVESVRVWNVTNLEEFKKLPEKVRRKLRIGGWPLLVAEKDGKILGSLEYEIENKTANASWITTKQGSRRQGISTLLMNRLQNIAVEENCSKIMVDPASRKASTFYSGLGMKGKTYRCGGLRLLRFEQEVAPGKIPSCGGFIPRTGFERLRGRAKKHA